MERVVGTVVRGLRGPIINEGDNIEQIVVETVLNAANTEGY
ncbi:F420-0--gamma-glutamyl ligase, partial [Lysinibacillus xylanilyticus]